jgi:hypothetical protein
LIISRRAGCRIVDQAVHGTGVGDDALEGRDNLSSRATLAR